MSCNETESSLTSRINMSAIIPKIQNISKGVIRVLGCNPSPMTLQGTNTYIIGSGKSRTLIDTGDGNSPEYINNLKYISQQEDFSISDILITHWHHDHTGGIEPLLKTFPSQEIRVHKLPFAQEDQRDYIPLKDGQIINAGEKTSLQVVYTPGHTPDHVIIHYIEEKIVFSGDCILGEGTAVFDNLKDYLESLQTIIELSPKKIYPGHGPIIEEPIPKLQYYIAHRNQREEQILGAFNESSISSLSIVEIVKKIYADTPKNLLMAAASNVKHHIDKLIQDEILEQDETDSNKYRLIKQ
nr:endoribonuclease LACTB2-like [Lepeophtheirus salmonis]